jgi:hypothetical protein
MGGRIEGGAMFAFFGFGAGGGDGIYGWLRVERVRTCGRSFAFNLRDGFEDPNPDHGAK